jgi:succinate-semialdehyde dehydrogenase/glutarate-semialdehyde dehydrogenase
MISSINPSTQKLIKKYQLYSSSEVELIINKTSKEYLEWKKISFNDRSFCFYSIADELEKDVDIHRKMISREMGKPILESKAEILKCVWLIRYFAKHAENFLQSEEIKTEYSQSYIQYDPLGVIFGIMPWNFPYWQVFRFIVPAMMAGNACIIKHASNVTGCSLLIEKLIKNTGITCHHCRHNKPKYLPIRKIPWHYTKYYP